MQNTKRLNHTEIAVVGAGLAGIATAYYASRELGTSSVLLIDREPPMSFTSAQSGDNYRNWWPHPVMRAFTNDSIGLIEQIARESANAINLTRRGYAIATRRDDIDELIADLHAGYGGAGDQIRIHSDPDSAYETASGDWTREPAGVDVLSNQALIRDAFPSFSPDIRHVLHIRRAGDISGQALGQYMLEQLKGGGGGQLRGDVIGIERGERYLLDIETPDGRETVSANIIVNAAGPFANEIAAMLGVELPIRNVFQQKVLFEDNRGVVPRIQPFAIDVDEQQLDWSDEERVMLAADPETNWLTRPIRGGAHCRPEGGMRSRWVKLGWAYNSEPGEPMRDVVNDPKFDPQFPEIVMRGASRLNPALKNYVDAFPGRFTHYGGYYPMTEENWPLIGPMDVENTYIVGALSGFGTMAACAAGKLCAAWIDGKSLPEYATMLSISRCDDSALIHELRNAANKGVL